MKTIDMPKYYLADVPGHVRARVLKLCYGRRWHEALELLQTHGFKEYTVEDLFSFYDWAPEHLPCHQEPEPPPPTPENPRDYTQPSPEVIADIGSRLAVLTPEETERALHALKHESIEHTGSLLYRLGACLSSADLYEYRKTLFPPNSLVDPYSSGPPVLRPGKNGLMMEEGQKAATGDQKAAEPQSRSDANAGIQESTAPDRSVDSLPASVPTTAERQSEPEAREDARPPGGITILSELRDLIQRYVVLPDLAPETLALWVVHTYAFTLRQVSTYIGVVSPEKRCGKTTLLELLGLLANRALTAANISPSALFRVIQETQPTLLIDEADTFLQGRDELAGILNAGYRKGNAYVVRLGDGKPRKKEERAPEYGQWTQDVISDFAQYSCWCPKVMAAIGRLPDTLADRCIVIAMQRKMAGEQCERLRHLSATEYRKRCGDFVQQHRVAIANARPEIPSTLNDRAADIWEPLLAIADLAGGEWPDLARQAAVKLSGNADDEMTLLGYFLQDLRAWMLFNKVDRMLSRDLVEAFNPAHDRPWEDLRRGREINEWWLGGKMRELGIAPKSVRLGKSTGKGYLLEDIEGAIRRYVPSVELPSQSGPAATRKGQRGRELPPHTSNYLE